MLEIIAAYTVSVIIGPTIATLIGTMVPAIILSPAMSLIQRFKFLRQAFGSLQGMLTGASMMAIVFYVFSFFNVEISQLPFWITGGLFTLYNLARVGKAGNKELFDYELNQFLGFIGGALASALYILDYF